MKLQLKAILLPVFLTLGMLFSTNAVAQSSCCGSENDKKTNCKETTKDDTATSGCLPSACRGAKTKHGEAKVISNLRLNLIALKAEMEKTKKVSFNKRAYDIHGIVGKTDNESIAIIIKEIKIIEKDFAKKLNYKINAFVLPENKAKQVSYLNSRIENIKKNL